MNIEGTVNVLPVAPPSARLSALIASAASETNSSETLLVEYTSSGRWEMEYLRSPDINNDVNKLSKDRFREKYGDYYIAGYQRGYEIYGVFHCRSVIWASTT
jgi:hypothetical protein